MDRPEQRRVDLVDRLRAALADHQASEKKMFGGVCFMLNGNMVAGTLRNELLVRVGKDGNAAVLRRPHAHPMEHIGRPVPGYVMVTSRGTDSNKDLKDWVNLAVAYVCTLPAKGKKASVGKRSRKVTKPKSSPMKRTIGKGRVGPEKSKT